MWKLYDARIEAIPDGVKVEEAFLGSSRAFVRSEEGAGIASVTMAGTGGSFSGDLRGRSLRETAALIRSWNMEEASLGMAAINAFHNTPYRMNGIECCFSNAFDAYAEVVKGKKAATIGHFFAAEKLESICTLSVFEREPQTPSDLPDTAEEYLLPGHDVVFITGMSITNKSLPRLLTLCGEADVVLVGPSVPLSPRSASLQSPRSRGRTRDCRW